MMTSDKDYGQLVSDHTFIYRPSSKGGYELRGPKEVCAIYGLKRPEQVIDLLALEGDASDNIPGCPGVGEKTAAEAAVAVVGILRHEIAFSAGEA